MPILGIIASSRLSAVAVGDYESIATVSVGSGGQASVTFSSIPATFKHLQIRGIGKDNRGYGYDNLMVQFNSDTATGNYTTHLLDGDGSTASAAAYVQNIATAVIVNALSDTTYLANGFGAFVIDILDYANTSKYKTTRALGGVDNNNTIGIVGLTSGLWSNTVAISSILIKGLNGGTLQQYSHFALYGIK
jgi:hypothetical protein